MSISVKNINFWLAQKVCVAWTFCRYASLLQYSGPAYAISFTVAVLIFLRAFLASRLASCLVGGAATTSEYMFSSDGALAAFVTRVLGRLERFCFRITQHCMQQAVMKQHRRMHRKTNTARTMIRCWLSRMEPRVSLSRRNWQSHVVSSQPFPGVGCGGIGEMTEALVSRVVGDMACEVETRNLAALLLEGWLRPGLMVVGSMVGELGTEGSTGTLLEALLRLNVVDPPVSM